MKRLITIALFAALALGAGGCGQVRETLGLTKRAPDEFAVYSREPLALPKAYDLKAPVPGRERPMLVQPQDRALQALLGPRAAQVQTLKAQPASPGLNAFSREIGVKDIPADIRRIVNEEDVRVAAEDRTWGDRIRFWGTDTVYGVVVDPEKETKRIQSNRALGRPINEGDVPVQEQKRKALLEGIF